MKMKREKRFRKAVWGIVLTAAILIPVIAAVLPDQAVQAGETAIKYQNSVFTKKLYQNIEKIGYGTDGSRITEDSGTIKEIYQLLAGMKLKAKNGAFKKVKNGVVTIVVYKKDGGKMRFLFSGGSMKAAGKVYKIVKNNPTDKFREYWDMEKENEIAKAVYPQMSPYPKEEDFLQDNGDYDSEAYSKAYDAWLADVNAQQRHSGYADGMETFLSDSTQTFLINDTEENRIYAPLNVYMALSMLAELTDHNSRQQILDLLGCQDITGLRRQAGELWNANYRDDGIVTSILANSLWMNESVNFKRPVMDILAENYYASSYKGAMGTEPFNQLFRNWLNEQTGGLLKEQASSEKFDAQTVMALASTIYFKARWEDEFYKGNTYEEIFHAASGSRNCDFMHRSASYLPYFRGGRFSAVSLALNGSCAMWFLRPDDGVTPQDLLKDSQALHFLTNKEKEQKTAFVNLSIPKFDVSSSFALEEGLKSLGVTDVFDAAVSDFSTMTSDLNTLCVTKTNHAARAAVDEEGVTAAAYTVVGIDNTAALIPDDEIDFVLDRPFLFAVTNREGLPLFTGVVYEP